MTPRTDKGGFVAWAFRRYLTFRLRGSFEDVRLLGGAGLRSLLENQPLILACNHVAWWDPLLLVHLDRVLGSDGYCLMDKENLTKFAFFASLGAIPLDRSSSLKSYRDLMRGSELLDRPGRLLAIFPQGLQRPAHLPLELKPGVSVLALGGAPVVPLAIRYDFREGPKPCAHLSAGEPLFVRLGERSQRTSFVRRLGSALQRELLRIDSALSGEEESGESLIWRQRSQSYAPRGIGVRLLNQIPRARK